MNYSCWETPIKTNQTDPDVQFELQFLTWTLVSDPEVSRDLLYSQMYSVTFTSQS